jgi:hypothetical protein
VNTSSVSGFCRKYVCGMRMFLVLLQEILGSCLQTKWCQCLYEHASLFGSGCELFRGILPYQAQSYEYFFEVSAEMMLCYALN